MACMQWIRVSNSSTPKWSELLKAEAADAHQHCVEGPLAWKRGLALGEVYRMTFARLENMCS